MKILFCNYEYPPIGGGGGVINADLAEELAGRHEVSVLSSAGLDLPAEEIVNNVRVVRVPVYFRRRQAAANLPSLLAFLPSGKKGGRRLLDGERFDVINTHFALPSGPVGQSLADRAGIPNVLSVHGGDLYDPSKWTSPHRHLVLRKWISTLVNRADHVIAQSRNTLANLHRYYAPDNEGDLIPLGIKRPRPAGGSRSDYGLPADAAVLVTIGRLVARKAVDQLIDAMAALKDQPVSLVIMGSGPEEGPLRQQTAARGLQDRVHLMGHVSEDDKTNLLGLSDMYVSTSQHEGFGLVFLEAMAHGLPVICYDCGGQTDFLSDGRTGRLIELNDRDGFVGAIRQLVTDKALRREFGGTNRQVVEEFYIDTCASRYEQVFEKLVGERRSESAAT